jgi:hypothetical protein
LITASITVGNGVGYMNIGAVGSALISLPSGSDELDRSERAFVRHLAGAHQILEGDRGDGLAAAVVSGIDRALGLLCDLEKSTVSSSPSTITLTLIGTGSSRAGAIVVEPGVAAVDSVRHRADERARRGLGLIEDTSTAH